MWALATEDKWVARWVNLTVLKSGSLTEILTALKMVLMKVEKSAAWKVS